MWKAWIADSSSTPVQRFIHAAAGYERLDGVMIASSWMTLASTSHLAPLNIDEHGAMVAPFDEVWTGVRDELAMQFQGGADSSKPVFEGFWTNPRGVFDVVCAPEPFASAESCAQLTLQIRFTAPLQPKAVEGELVWGTFANGRIGESALPLLGKSVAPSWQP